MGMSVIMQVFNDEFSAQQSGTIRQQVLDMLFSRMQLHPLQTYVCSQVSMHLPSNLVVF